jgi:hypothetical protein
LNVIAAPGQLTRWAASPLRWSGFDLSRKFFIVGFILGMGFVLAANLYSYHVTAQPCCDLGIPFGFPFPLGRTGGFVGGNSLIMVGVFADVIVGLVVSVVFAWVFAKVLPSMINRCRQVGHWHSKTSS